MYQQIDRRPFTLSHCWMKLNDTSKWSELVRELKSPNKKQKTNDGSSTQQLLGSMKMVGEVERDCISYMCAKNEEKEGEARKGEAWESGEVIAALVGEDHVQQRG